MTDYTSREDMITDLAEYTGLDRTVVDLADLSDKKLSSLFTQMSRGEEATDIFQNHWDACATMLIGGGLMSFFVPPVGLFFAALGGVSLAGTYGASKLLDKREAVKAVIREAFVPTVRTGQPF